MDGLNFNAHDTRVKATETTETYSFTSTDVPVQGNFKNVLNDAISRQESVRFSKHANMRLSDRRITLTGEQISRVEVGLNKAHAKGIKDSLVLLDDVALVVNIKSKTVITALSSEHDTVFSNIDGAVIV